MPCSCTLYTCSFGPDAGMFGLCFSWGVSLGDNVLEAMTSGVMLCSPWFQCK